MKDWLFCRAGLTLALEMGQASLFLQMRLTDPQLYMTVFFQLSYRRARAEPHFLAPCVTPTVYAATP